MKKADINNNESRKWLIEALSGKQNAIMEAGKITDPTDRELFYYFKEMDNYKSEEKEIVNHAWERLRAKLMEDDLLPESIASTGSKASTSNIARTITPLIKIAAAISLLVVLSFTAYLITNQWTGKKSLITAVTGTNEKLMVELPDGSTVHLNRNSELKYKSAFKGEIRKVQVTGEALFDVNPDKEKPFIVETPNAKIRVTGTKFNVLTDNGNNEVEVMVMSGQVIITDKNGMQEMVLDPDLIGTMGNTQPTMFRNNDPNYLSWSTEILTYDGTSLDKTFRDLKRVHNIEVRVSDKAIFDKKISTTFDRQSPQTIISIICTTFNLEFEISDSIYYLSEK